MNIEQRLSQVADRYRAQGYKVVVRPGPDDLPAFAKDFKVEIVARRDDGCVLASVKKNQADLEADPNIASYAEVTNNQIGWRFDLSVLGPEPQPMPEKRKAKEPSERRDPASFGRCRADAPSGFRPAVSHRRLGRAGGGHAKETSGRRGRGRLGNVSTDDAERTLLGWCATWHCVSGSRRLFQARSAIVHGFTTPAIEKSAVQFLIETARRLLLESQPAKQTA